MNFYNEIDPFAAAWLRELIKSGHIAPGVVDERSIEDISPDELKPFTQCHFFAGIGVWSYALRRAGWPDDRPVWTGSCPCQPFSTAGKGSGKADERHLWPAWFHLISECRPHVVFGEQVEAAIRFGWLDSVQADLEGIGYGFGVAGLPAAGFGAPHQRARLYFVGGVAHSECKQEHEELKRPTTAERGRSTDESCGCRLDDASPFTGAANGEWGDADWLLCRDGKWRPVESGTFPLAHGSPARVGRLRGYGNAIVAPVAEAFIVAAMEAMEGS